MQKRMLLQCLLIAYCLMAGVVFASDWTNWRGPNQNGVSPETGLVSTWSLDGENLAWRADFVGRSTPIVLNGRVYVVGRTGAGQTMQRSVACFNAASGELIWEDKTNVFHTTVPFTRLGWSSLAGDPETGNVYLFGVEGLFICYDKDGKIVWKHSMEEEYNRFSGYGGRTATPVVDEDLVIINQNYHTWGNMMIPRHRFLAFDKRSGELVWNTPTDEGPANTNYSVPVVAEINGVRTLVCGGADGAIYALKVRTGEKIWKFSFSKTSIQASVVVEGDRVYACHSFENLDNETIGRVVCIDAIGSGDITATNEVWRNDGLEIGFTSPLIYDNRLYVVSNQGDLHALDANTGKEYWRFNLGTVGKGSPVWADGKIYATAVNGMFHILKPEDDKAVVLDSKEIEFDDKRAAEIYGSPAVGYGRVYFATENGLFSLGAKGTSVPMSESNHAMSKPDMGSGPVAHIQIVPAEAWIYDDKRVNFKVRTFDSQGRQLPDSEASFSLTNLAGEISNSGVYVPGSNVRTQGGYVTAKVGDLESQARLMVSSHVPFSEDFESFTVDKNIPFFPGAWKFFVKDDGGNKVLAKPPSARNLNRHNLYIGPPDMANYTIQADLKAEKVKRRSPDMGVIASRYYFDFMTKKKQLQIRTWPAELERLSADMPFEWDPETWYTMKLTVEYKDGKGHIMGKIWPRDQQEPAEWTLTVVDPIPNQSGSPGLYGDAATTIFYDNVKISAND